jgi:hypothetical protein
MVTTRPGDRSRSQHPESPDSPGGSPPRTPPRSSGAHGRRELAATGARGTPGGSGPHRMAHRRRVQLHPGRGRRAVEQETAADGGGDRCHRQGRRAVDGAAHDLVLPHRYPRQDEQVSLSEKVTATKRVTLQTCRPRSDIPRRRRTVRRVGQIKVRAHRHRSSLRSTVVASRRPLHISLITEKVRKEGLKRSVGARSVHLIECPKGTSGHAQKALSHPGLDRSHGRFPGCWGSGGLGCWGSGGLGCWGSGGRGFYPGLSGLELCLWLPVRICGREGGEGSRAVRVAERQVLHHGGDCQRARLPRRLHPLLPGIGPLSPAPVVSGGAAAACLGDDGAEMTVPRGLFHCGDATVVHIDSVMNIPAVVETRLTSKPPRHRWRIALCRPQRRRRAATHSGHDENMGLREQRRAQCLRVEHCR